jgi:hypothetical protein
MPMTEEELGRTVDEVLEAAWARERRRATRRAAWSDAGRLAAGLGALVGLGLVMRLLFGVVVPWTCFAFVGVLCVLAVVHAAGNQPHLRRGRVGPER